ncbi:unnamed protein product [Heligmosomoides polygyrus]|uniref:RNase H domain-containing protein n=1 Tax=Heligmosomoides polygyrus TaxID=6339 RepID=A0A183GMC3_HELPZ|nr:unnamed protein product [Heligmosomoides polygyrus]
MLPLIHKLFLHCLWQYELDLDEEIPPHLKEKWGQVIKDMLGFTKTIPRFLMEKDVNVVLVSFTDASSEAIPACIYLCSDGHSNLLMAKSKLPSIKSKATIPKLELDAVTIALRITNAVVSQVQSTLSIRQVFILTDSEITLKWIKSRPLKEAGVMVFNRLMEIERIIDHLHSSGREVFFCHIPTTLDPADCTTVIGSLSKAGPVHQKCSINSWFRST